MVDDQPQILMWTLDEVVVVTSCLLAGIVFFNQAVPGLIVGLFISHYYAKLKSGKNDGYLNHLLWKYFFIPLFKGKVYVDPSIKRLIAL